MRAAHKPVSLPSRRSRVVAWLAAGLVILLSMSANSPELHAWLHAPSLAQANHTCGHSRAAADAVPDSGSEEGENHACAVTLFSQGVVHQAVALLTQPCEGILRAVNVRAFERFALAQPRYLHRPPQAPPAA